MTINFIMVVYGEMGRNFSLIFNDVISCWILDDKYSEVYHSVANSFSLNPQVCLHFLSV